MPNVLRKCTFPGCPRTGAGGRCPEHAAQAERVRGSRQERGYDREHDRLRAWWQARMDAGVPVFCWRCRERIDPFEPWDLGHEGGRHRGPEHASLCNRSAGGRLGATVTNERG